MEAAGRSDEDVVSESYTAPVQNHQSVVGIKILSDLNIPSIIAPEIRFNQQRFSGLSENVFNQLIPRLTIIDGKIIVFLTEDLTPGPVCNQGLVIICIIHLPAEHFFFFGHFLYTPSL